MAKSPDFPFASSLTEVLVQRTKPRLIPETGWHKIGVSEAYAIGFTNSWAAANDVDEAEPAFYVSESGEARFRGKVDGGAVGTIMFVLPPEARPEYREKYTCSMEGGWANVEVDQNGNVTLVEFGG